MPTLTKYDMYDRDGNCILSHFVKKRDRKMPKYIPAIEEEKHRKQREEDQ